MAHVNFANERLSGHLFGGAVAQEEILMATRPELIAASLFCEKLHPEEVVIVRGTKRFSKASGYGRTVKCCPLNKVVGARKQQREDVAILCMDAQYGAVGKDETEILRDLNKAYLAFSRGGQQGGVSTGRWGAGMFAKSPRLTFVQQFLAAVEADIPAFDYAVFDNLAEKQEFEHFVSSVEGCTVGQLFNKLIRYSKHPNRPNINLLEEMIRP